MTMPTMIVPIILLKILAMMEPAIAKITKTIAIQTSDSTSTTDHLNPKRYPRTGTLQITVTRARISVCELLMIHMESGAVIRQARAARCVQKV